MRSTRQLRKSGNIYHYLKKNSGKTTGILLRAIEATGGICLHLAAKKLKKGAESLAHCFEILGESLIDKKLADSLIKMSRFRNILIHKYWEIDERRIYEYAKNNLEDFENFIKAVNQFLKP